MHPYTSPSPALVEYRKEKHNRQVTQFLGLCLVLAFLALILVVTILH